MENNIQLLDNGLLEIVLERFLKKEYPDSEKIIILDRVLNNYSSTFPTEIVTCQIASDKKTKVFCKYFTREAEHKLYGHRGNQVYESLIYQYILRSMNVNYPKYYGTHFEPTTKKEILFLGYLENAVRFSKVPSSIIEAVKWIAKFHKKSQDKIDYKESAFMKRYDLNYYHKWADRTLEFTSIELKNKYPWLHELCENYKSNVHLLLSEPLSVIHGECYPGNVLYCEGHIVPIDWESAAVANGVIDLASLTEGWDFDTVEECISKYCSIIHGKPEVIQFRERFDLAQTYWLLRWIGSSKKRTNHEKILWHFEKLYEIGKKLELI